MYDCISIDNYLKWLYIQAAVNGRVIARENVSCVHPKGQCIATLLLLFLFQSESFKKRCYCEMCMYVCITFVYVCIYICMYVCMFVCMYVCMCTKMHLCMYVCIHVCMYMYVYTYVCMYVCMYIHIYIYIYIYILCMYGSVL